MVTFLRSAAVAAALIGYGGLLWCHCHEWPLVCFYVLLLLAVGLEAIDRREGR
jgi:hypothetical protein